MSHRNESQNVQKFYLESVEISGLWGLRDIELALEPDVNILIGENGTGKTTILNLIHLSLTGDVPRLARYTFDSVRLSLKEFGGRHVRTISIERQEPGLVFKVGRERFPIPLSKREMEIRRISIRHHQYRLLRDELAQLTDTIWLPVSRRLPIPDEDERSFEAYSRHHPRLESVEERLRAVLESLRDYRVRLEASLGQIYKDFERRVLAAILYDPKLDKFDDLRIQSLSDEDKKQLIRAFAAADLLTPEMEKQIDAHFKKAESVVKEAGEGIGIDDVLILPLVVRTKKLAEFARELEAQRESIFARLESYVNIVNEYLTGKRINVNDSGRLVITETPVTKIHREEKSGDLERQLKPTDLSSGEKQILIMLTSALVKSDEATIYLADEPELSLHVTWQARLIESLTKLSDRSQLIVATHSPDIVGDYVDRVIRLTR